MVERHGIRRESKWINNLDKKKSKKLHYREIRQALKHRADRSEPVPIYFIDL